MPGILDNRLLLVTGKGGVGKSTLSAALAQAFAREGRKTLVCELNVEERVSRLLERPPVGSNIGRLEENLWAVDIRPEDAMREYGLMVLKFKALYQAVFENRVVERFLRFIPSLAELVMLGKVIHHVEERLPNGDFRFDRVVVDAPATGHALAFFAVPQVLMTTVPPGPLFSEAKRMRAVLNDPKTTSAVLVSLPEELPVNETLELAGGVRRLGIFLPALVLNAFAGRRFSADEIGQLSATPLRGAVHAEAERACASFESKRKLEGLGVPVVTVPRLYEPTFGRTGIEAVASHLKRAGAWT